MSKPAAEKKKVDIVWNITNICMWDCEICCVDAVHVTPKNRMIHIRSDSLSNKHEIADNRNTSIFDQAQQHQIQQMRELTLEQKYQVIDNLKDYNAKIDFSGGDPLCVSDTLSVVKRAYSVFGKENITMTATGAGLALNKIKDFMQSLVLKLELRFL